MIEIAVTDHPYSKTVCEAFAEGCNGKLVSPKDSGSLVACYGVLRGCDESINRAKDFLYIDHSYFSTIGFNHLGYDGYYRIVHNALWHPSVDKADKKPNWDRFNELGLKLKQWKSRRAGRYILLIPPSNIMEQFFSLQTWTKETMEQVTKFTDRSVIVHYKNSVVPLKELLPDAHCVLTSHSNAGLDALMSGCPVIYTHPERKLGEIKNIEKPPMNSNFLARLADHVWSLDEMREGIPWKYYQSILGLTPEKKKRARSPNTARKGAQPGRSLSGN